MGRKLLFVVFSDEACRQRHALMYAIDLCKKGHEAKILVEGPATRMFVDCLGKDEGFDQLYHQAKKLGLFAGVCQTAAAGCGGPQSGVTAVVQAEGLTLCADCNQHAGIEPFVRDGYEIVVF